MPQIRIGRFEQLRCYEITMVVSVTATHRIPSHGFQINAQSRVWCVHRCCPWNELYCTCPCLAYESGARYACVRSIPNREPIYCRTYFRGWGVGERWRTRGRRIECRPPTALSDRELPPVGHGEVDHAQWACIVSVVVSTVGKQQ